MSMWMARDPSLVLEEIREILDTRHPEPQGLDLDALALLDD